MIINLVQMKSEESGIVAEIRGGCGVINKLESIGIIPGKIIKKISSQPWRGPQTIEINNIQVAIGFGMARKIFIKIDRCDSN